MRKKALLKHERKMEMYGELLVGFHLHPSNQKTVREALGLSGPPLTKRVWVGHSGPPAPLRPPHAAESSPQPLPLLKTALDAPQYHLHTKRKL